MKPALKTLQQCRAGVFCLWIFFHGFDGRLDLTIAFLSFWLALFGISYLAFLALRRLGREFSSALPTVLGLTTVFSLWHLHNEINRSPEQARSAPASPVASRQTIELESGEGWHHYESPDGAFSLMLPTKPSVANEFGRFSLFSLAKDGRIFLRRDQLFLNELDATNEFARAKVACRAVGYEVTCGGMTPQGYWLLATNDSSRTHLAHTAILTRNFAYTLTVEQTQEQASDSSFFQDFCRASLKVRH
jgi:hypothetical protein